MSPVFAVAVLLFSLLSLATSGEIDELKKKIEEVKKEIQSAKDKKHELLKEEEVSTKHCSERVRNVTLEQSELSAEIEAEMKTAKALVNKIDSAHVQVDTLSKYINRELSKSLEKLILLSALWKEDLELFKRRRADGSYEKCLSFVYGVSEIAPRSKISISDDNILLLRNELEELNSDLNFVKSENEILSVEEKKLTEECDLRIKNFNVAIAAGSKDAESAKELVKRLYVELSSLGKIIEEKNHAINDLKIKTSKELESLKEMSKNLNLYVKDKACYKKLEQFKTLSS